MIGIINMQWFDNPGAVWLCYGLQNTIRDITEQEVIVIDYATGGGKESNNSPTLLEKVKGLSKRIILRLYKRKKVEGIPFCILLQRRHELYEEFRGKNLCRTSRFCTHDSNVLDKDFSHCIVGSDVVWKPEIADSAHAYVYFLQFCRRNTKRVAYAASIGTNDEILLGTMSQRYEELIKGFDAISVREKSASVYIKERTNIDVYQVLDPVFLLERKDYDAIIGEDRDVKEPYLYLYLLSYDKEIINFAIDIAETKGLKIVYDLHLVENIKMHTILKDIGVPVVADGPIEFLKRIKGAECVISNSFHGTAFSIIYHKDFYTFGKINSGVNISSRMKDLLTELCLENRYVSELSDRDITDINYDMVDEILQKKKEESINYLRKALC